MKYSGTMRRILFATALVSAPLLGVSAQGRGGGGDRGGGGGGGTGMVDMTGMGGGGFGVSAPRPLFYDLNGPFSFDTFTVMLTLEPAKFETLQTLRAAHIAATAVLRDSVKAAATELGLTAVGSFGLTANSKPELAKVYDKQLQTLRKLDVAFFEKKVKPELTKDQFTAMKNWYGQQRPIGQAGRGGGPGGQGGGQGRGGGGGRTGGGGF